LAFISTEETNPNITKANNAVTKWQKTQNQKCGPMPNLMAALPNIGGALCPTPQSLADAHY